jgi:hypothetical protein
MRSASRRAGAASLYAAALLLVSVVHANPSTGNASDAQAPAPVVVRQGTPIADDPRPTAPGRVPASPTEMSPLTHRCFVRDVMAFYDRTHVRCHNAAGERFIYFAVDTSQPVAETLLVKAWRSMRSGKPLRLKYAPPPDLNPPNCKPANCRRLLDAVN